MKDKVNNKDLITRIGICAYFDEDGILQPYMIHYLYQMTRLCRFVVLVVNGKFFEEEKKKIAEENIIVVVRGNEGYDFSAYKEGISYVIDHYCDQIDELVLFNSSCYALTSCLNNIFDKMEVRNIDFWGITQWYNMPPFPDHIQSYFYVFRKRILKSTDFKAYWDRLPKIKSREDAINQCETKLTKYFHDKGYSWDTYIPPKECEYSMENVLEGLEEGMPLVKRKYFFLEPNLEKRKAVFNFLKNYHEDDLIYILDDYFREKCLRRSKMHGSTIIQSIRACLKRSHPNIVRFVKHIKWRQWRKISKN